MFKEFLFQSKIINSEAYRKYLLHKDISKYRARYREVETDLPVTEIERKLDDSRCEEDKIPQDKTLSNWKDIPKADLKLELKETKRKYKEDIAEILLKINYYLSI